MVRTRYSPSLLAKLLNWHRHDVEPPTYSDSLAFGTMCHNAVLTPDRGTDEEKKNYKYFKAHSRQVWHFVDKRVNGIRDVSPLRDNYEVECTYESDLYGFPVQGTIDIFDRKDKVIYDIKTTSDPSNFEEAFTNWHYDMQMYMYMKMTETTISRLLIFKNHKTIDDLRKSKTATNIMNTMMCPISQISQGKAKMLDAFNLVEKYGITVDDLNTNEFVKKIPRRSET